jgi:hypothetical protein
VPLLGRYFPDITFAKVDLPDPLVPMNVEIGVVKSSEMPDKAVTLVGVRNGN